MPYLKNSFRKRIGLMKEKKVLFLIPDGVGIRNYLYSDVLKNVKTEAKIAFWSPLPENAFDEVKALHQIDIEYKYCKLLPESFFSRIYKEAATYARLKTNAKVVDNPTILANWIKQNKSFKQKQLYRLAEIIGSWASKKYSRILSLEQKAKKHWPNQIIESYKQDLKELKPSSIFITHQRVSGLMPICIAAKELNIPVVSAIYSWDNLPKARLNIQADKYIVWSDYMKQEMQLYYPEVDLKDVITTGTPQFEFYSQKDRIISREEFAKKHGLDATKKWICFSGDDRKTSPYDQNYLQDIAESINKEAVQILFRRCPVDFSDRFNKVLELNKDSVISVNPLWYSSEFGWTSFFSKISDISLLLNVAFHCDLVINVGSTMAHDFAMFDKPCFYINYDQENSSNWSVKRIYNFQHFRSMQGIEAVGWLNSKEEIKLKIDLALYQPESIGKERQKWLEKIIQHPIEETSKKIAEIILR
jgi:hypothetical protein